MLRSTGQVTWKDFDKNADRAFGARVLVATADMTAGSWFGLIRHLKTSCEPWYRYGEDDTSKVLVR